MAKQEKIRVIYSGAEQRPWVLDPERFEMLKQPMRTGDYTIDGHHDHGLTIERKSLGDFVGTVIGDWIRFRKELWRMAAFDFALIVVEADIEDVFSKRYESDASPASVIGRANGIYLDHGIPVVWWGKRTCCVSMVENFLELAAKKLGGP